MALACAALWRQRSFSKSARNCAEMKRILLDSCICCLRMKRSAHGQLGAEEDDRLAPHETVLGAAEGEDVDAGICGGLAEIYPEGRSGVADAGTVHVQVHVEFVRGVGDRLDLIERSRPCPARSTA